jgi:hypothetical protein
MADKEDQIIEDEEVVEDQSQDDAQVDDQEEVEESQQDEEEQLEEDEQEEEDQEVEQKPSRREQLRINDLLRKYGPPEERRAPQTDGIDYRSMIDADDEVYTKLGEASQQYGNQQYQQGLKEAEKVKFETRLEIDAPRVATQYPQLDKNSDEFNGPVANSINQMYLSAVGYDEKTGYVQNPNLRYAEYVDAFYELVNEAASRKVETTRRNVTRQAARTSLRPDGSSAKTQLDLSKDPSQMSDKELDAAMSKLGLAPKSNKR